MADCNYCQIIEGKIKANIIYEDEVCLGILESKPAVPGHVRIITKEHYPIFEQVPDKTLEKVFEASNVISSILFEVLGCQGTNILVNNGYTSNQVTPHFSVDILPRQEKDGINLDWEMKPASKDEIETADLMLLNITKDIFIPKEKTKPIEINTKPEVVEEAKKGEIDYQVEQLNRMP